MRRIERTYQDPVEIIWIAAARRMGMTIARSADVNASWDGKGVLWIGTPETLDPDDCLAQMILHETCHALCEGPAGWTQTDWGLESDNRDHRIREHACLRLQAALADTVGMRQFFAATTVFRRYYDRIPPAALEDDGDPAVPLARAAFHEATAGLWAQPLADALSATARIAAILGPLAGDGSLWSGTSSLESSV